MKRIILMLLVAAVALIPGKGFAAKTKLEDVWQDKQQHIVVRKIAVFWLARSSENRLFAENEFVRQLKERGLIAMPAYVIIPPDRFVERDEVMAKIRELGVDTVLTLRPVNKLTGKTDFPKTGPAGPSDLSGYYQFVYDQPAADTSGAVYVETVLFDAASGIRVWAARSVTKVDAVDPDVLRDFVEIMIDRLVSDKMLH
jgi:hypothetical protein